MMPGALTDKCTIQVRGLLGQGPLGSVKGWVDEQIDVPCLFDMMSADMITRLYGESVLRAAKVLLPPTAIITENTRQISTSAPGFAGTWIVKGVFPRKLQGRLYFIEVNLIPAIDTDVTLNSEVDFPQGAV